MTIQQERPALRTFIPPDPQPAESESWEFRLDEMGLTFERFARMDEGQTKTAWQSAMRIFRNGLPKHHHLNQVLVNEFMSALDRRIEAAGRFTNIGGDLGLRLVAQEAERAA